MFGFLKSRRIKGLKLGTDRRPRPSRIRVESLEQRDNPSGIVAIGSSPGAAPIVTVYDATTQVQKFTITAYDSSFTGGVNVAIGDVNGDGVADVITGTGVGGGPDVRVFSGVDGSQIGSFTAGDADSRSGVTVAAADFDADGKADIVIGAMSGGNPIVRVLRFADGSVLKTYSPPAGASAVNVAAADVNGDGTPDVIAAAGQGGGPRVTVYNGANDQILSDFFTFEESFTGGVHVSTGDFDADGRADIITAANVGGGPRVQVFSGQSGGVLQNYFAYDSTLRNGVRAFAFDANADGTIDLVTSEGPGLSNSIQAVNYSTLANVGFTSFTALPTGAEAIDQKAPTVTVAATADAATATSPIAFTATFSEAVNGFTAAGITVTNGTVSNFVRVSASSYTFDVTPTAEGAVTVVIPAAVATDVVGYSNPASTSVSVSYDLSNPVVTASTVLSNSAFPTLTGTVDDESSTVIVQVDGQSVTATVSGTTWTVTLPASVTDGTYDIVVTATDASGNVGTVTATAALTVDTASPTVTLSSDATDPTSTNPIPMTATFGEDVNGFDVADLVVTNGSVTNFVSLGGGTYTFDIVPAGAGAVTVSVPAGAVTDLAGNGSAASEVFTRTFDGTVTGVALTTTEPAVTNADVIPVTVTFQTDVTGFDQGDLEVTNGTVSNFTALSGSTFTFDVTPDGDGEVTVVVIAGAALDGAGNPTSAASLFVVSDRTAPTATVTANGSTNSSPVAFTVTFAEDVTGFDEADLTVANGTVSGFTAVDGRTYTVEVTPTEEGTVSLTVLAGGVADAAGNSFAEEASGSAVYDTTAPTVSVSTTATDPTESSPITVTVTFSESVTGFTADDVTIENGIVSNFTDGGNGTYTFDVTPITAGDVTIVVPANAATDAGGNANLASDGLTVSYTGAAYGGAAGLSETMPDADAAEWETQSSGLKVWDIQTGTGPAVTDGATVEVYYTGWLAADGTEFDSNRTDGNPISFSLSGVIEGWQEGLVGMQPGGIRRLYVPAALGYGAAGYGSIPGNADLVFEVKLIAVS